MSTLLLVPTERERRALTSALADACLVGFGPIAAAARTADLLRDRRPARVLLVGIAGTYDESVLAVGAAATFGSVALDGVGAGEGDDQLDPTQLGLSQWRDRERGAVGERLPLAGPGGATLLTVCSASTSIEMARRRQRRHDGAIAEDMEGFAVAFACHLRSVPLLIVRGISNRAGDREHRNWQIDEAITAAAERARRLVDTPEAR